jgi:serine/threonine-protein kinase
LLAYVPGGAAAAQHSLVWVDRQGRTELAMEERGSYVWPRLSPDGKRIAVSRRGETGKVDVWILDLVRATRSRLTVEAGNILPVWSPDGERVAFSSNRRGAGGVDVYWKAAHGRGNAERLLAGDHARFPRSFSPDGRTLAITEYHSELLRNILLLHLDGPAEPVSLLATRFDEYSPMISPDGRWLAYVSDESGRDEVYVQPFPEGAGRWTISTGGGREPVWSPDGRELFYRRGNTVMAVAVTATPAFQAGRPEVLFQGRFQQGVYGSHGYDISPDGQRFLMVEPGAESALDRIHVVLDGFTHLEQDPGP